MKILKIYKESFSGNVYDLQCDETSNFFANGLLIHNCYRDNSPDGIVMPIEKFEKIIKMLDTGILNQVALSIGSIGAVPNLMDYFILCRHHDLVPNITFSSNDPGLTDAFMEEASRYIGACAISNYNIDQTINVVQRFKKYLKSGQVNVHQLLSNETYDNAVECVKRYQDHRAHAVVFLWVKPKGRASSGFYPVNLTQLGNIIKIAQSSRASIGFDTCGSVGAIEHYKSTGEYDKVKSCIERCCSTRFSIFCDEKGDFYPCSFTTGFDEVTPISIDDVSTINDIV